VPDFIINILNVKMMESYLGIDASKGYSDFILLDKNKQPLEEGFQLDDTRSGHSRLKGLLQQFIAVHGISLLYCGIESTGGFENNWYAWFIEMSKSMPVKIARLNPAGVKKNIEAGLNRNITDALSARYIAEYLISHPEKATYQGQDTHYASFRDVQTCLNLQKKQSTQLINELKMLLYSSFPEMVRFCKDSIPTWVLDMLILYPVPAYFVKLKPERLARIRHVTLKKAENIIEKAKTSIASHPDLTRGFIIKSLASQILQKQEAIKEFKGFLAANCSGPEVDLLQTIKGIGAYSAASIMVEIEDIKRFPSAKHLAAYFGLHPELKQSGDKKVSRLSKKGRPAIRATLYMCAQTAVVHDTHLKEIYHNHRSKGKTHRAAIGVIMHKLLRIVWGILSSNKPYDVGVDQKNRTKNIKEQINTDTEGVDKKRRFQEHDKNAPISSKQNKKRKAHLESQVGNA
jgi:transposase